MFLFLQFPLLSLEMSYDGGFSVFVQDHQKLLPGSVAAVTPLSFCRSCKGTSADSSHLHLGTAESLSLCRSDPLPQKLLAHLAESRGTELCPLSPYMLRLSGAGFAYYAPGPETSVWTQMQTLKLLHLRDPWITQRRHVQTHLKHGHSMLSSPCAFLGYTWVKNPLDSIALTPNSHTCLIFFFFFFFWFDSANSLLRLLLEKVYEQKENHVRKCFSHCGAVPFELLNLFVFPRLIFSLTLLPGPPLLRPLFSLLCKCLSETFMYILWSGQVRGIAFKLSPLGVRACAWAWVRMNFACLLYVCMWHTFALQVTTQQQARSQRRKVFRFRKTGKKEA